MVDEYDDGRKNTRDNALNPLNARKIPTRKTAVALQENEKIGYAPVITAAGRGIIAEQILHLAYESGIQVRSDSALAEMLAKVELDSPIPSEAFLAVAEILSYVYKANGQPNPFDTSLVDDTE